MSDQLSDQASNADSTLVFNGINGSTGAYLNKTTLNDLAAAVCKADIDRQEPMGLLRQRHQRDAEGHYGVAGIVDDPSDLAQAGWGVIFPATLRPADLAALREALQPLLDHRRAQATRLKEGRYQEFSGPEGYRPQEAMNAWVARHGMSPADAAEPDKIPYYLLLVGSPEDIPFVFQYQLDVVYAVGRLYFDRRPGETFANMLPRYAQYAQSVVAAETGRPFLPRQATFFSVMNNDDVATQLSHDQLVTPLAAQLPALANDWTLTVVPPAEATKDRLGHLLGGNETPALLFTASHGMGFDLDDFRLVFHQGALLCQDWPGPQAWTERIPETFYFSGDDLSADARVFGTIAFHFACYGAGTPRTDDFAFRTAATRQIAPRPFIARLPQALLAHPKGSALAVLGHIDRAWTYSFAWKQATEQTGAFRDTLRQIMRGKPVGLATEWVNQRYAAYATGLSDMLADARYGKTIDSTDLIGLWTANNDARAYVIFGDPAVYLPVDATTSPTDGPAARPVLTAARARTAATPDPGSSAPPATPAAVGSPAAEAETVAPAPQPPAHPRPESATAPLSSAPASGSPDLAADSRSEAHAQLAESLRDCANQLRTVLQALSANLSTVQVATYVSADLDAVTFDNQGAITGPAQRKALTRLSLTGDSVVCLPETVAGDDEKLWAIHNEMVARALAQRTELLTSAARALAGLIRALQ